MENRLKTLEEKISDQNERISKLEALVEGMNELLKILFQSTYTKGSKNELDVDS